MSLSVIIGNQRVRVDPRAQLGAGGEATVYNLGNGRALKLYTDESSLDEHQAKLPAMLERSWPAEIVAPSELATNAKGRIVGYVMQVVTPAEPLASYADRLFRNNVSDDTVLGLLRALHSALLAAHRAGVVVGDLNPFNVLVCGGRIRLIDADSYQLGRFACRLFTERYTDPRLLDRANGGGLLLAGRYDEAADWYAFSALLLECLAFVGPFGGVHRPKSGAALVPSERILQRVTVFSPDVQYPRPARPLDTLPADLLDHLRRVFEHGERGVFPPLLLERARLQAPAPVSVQLGLHLRKLLASDAPSPAFAIDAPPLTHPHDAVARYGSVCVWTHDGQLLTASRDPFASVINLGEVMPGTTRLWLGPRFGVGYYLVGAKPVAFLFSPTHRALNDSLPLPKLGAVIAGHGLASEDLATLSFYVRDGGKLLHRVVCFDPSGALVAEASTDQDSEAWIGQVSQAAALGRALFVPTDDGVVRVEPVSGRLAVTARFPSTREAVDAACRLFTANSGLVVVRDGEALLITTGGSS